MELGQKLKQARLAAGLSQRQLCGDMITRNMLSQIENGSARPSMDTLAYLASRLGKPVSYFLEEAMVSPNQQVMAAAREAWQQGKPEQVRKLLEGYQPDGNQAWERDLLWELASLALAEQAIRENRRPYALSLLREKGESPYCSLLAQRRQLLLSKIDPTAELPNVDEWLLAKARQALQAKDAARAGALLDTCEERTGQWHILRGEAYFLQEMYGLAAEHFRAGEKTDPDTAIPRLEECYRALEDYKMAYFYACKRR